MSRTFSKSPAARYAEKCHAMERVYEEYAKSKGLTYMSFAVLEIIYKHSGHCTQKMICEQSLYTKQSVNAIIKAFWEQGYVELTEEKADRRNKKIEFTQKGRSYADEIIGKYTAVENAAIRHLTDEQWEQLIGMAEIFEKHFAEGIRGLIEATAGK